MTPLEIDGSHGEGGGQLTRLAVAVAAIAGRPVHLVRIRARRAKPGLRAQHLAAVRAVATLCDGSLEGDEIGSDRLSFRPGAVRAGAYRFEVGTAGSVALVLQAALPVALRAGGTSLLTISGGTDVPKAPPLDYLRLVFLPWLARMGADVAIARVRRGYYPRGGGEIEVRVGACGRLKALRLVEPGALRNIAGLAHVANLPGHIAERMSTAAHKSLGGIAPAQIASHVLGEPEACGRGGAIVLAALTECGPLGSGVVAERGVPAERLGVQVAEELRMDLQAGATVDSHAADQLLVYLAQADAPSVLTARRITPHAATVMWLVEQLLPARFEVQQRERTCCIRVVPRRDAKQTPEGARSAP